MFDVFEQMHYVCFHYEFEHDIGRGETDVDGDCGVPGCPSGVLPVAEPGPDAQAALKDAAVGLRRPYAKDGWAVEFEGPGVLSARRDGTKVLLVAVEQVDDNPQTRQAGRHMTAACRAR